ncbi:MAG: hypothetical protein IKH13_00770, partial [Clostridia bacterium]|nr:hypothetical protein [Clostridia bacterium]
AQNADLSKRIRIYEQKYGEIYAVFARFPQKPHTASQSPRHFAIRRVESVIVGYDTLSKVSTSLIATVAKTNINVRR